MNVQKNARTTPVGRERIVRLVIERGQTPQAVGPQALLRIAQSYEQLALHEEEWVSTAKRHKSV